MPRAFKKETTPEWDRDDETEFRVEKIVGKRYVFACLIFCFSNRVSAPGFSVLHLMSIFPSCLAKANCVRNFVL